MRQAVGQYIEGILIKRISPRVSEVAEDGEHVGLAIFWCLQG